MERLRTFALRALVVVSVGCGRVSIDYLDAGLDTASDGRTGDAVDASGDLRDEADGDASRDDARVDDVSIDSGAIDVVDAFDAVDSLDATSDVATDSPSDVVTDPSGDAIADVTTDPGVDSGCGDTVSSNSNCGFCGTMCVRGSACRRSRCRPSFVDQLDFDGLSHVVPMSVVYDEAGNSYVAIQFQGGISLPVTGTSLSAPGPTDIDVFVASFDVSGGPRWALHVTSTDDETTPRLAYAPGALYLGFASSSGTDLSIARTPVPNGQDNVVVRLNPNDAGIVWYARSPSENAGFLSSMIADADGVLVAGVASGEYGFGVREVTPAGQNAFVVSLDATSGSTLWLTGMGATDFGDSRGPHLAFVDGDVGVAMDIGATDAFVGPRVIVDGAPGGGRDVLLARLARATGTPQGAKLVDQVGDQFVAAIVGRPGSIAVFGSTMAAFALPGVTARRAYAGNEDAFILTATTAPASDPMVDGVTHLGGADDDWIAGAGISGSYYYVAGASGPAAADWGSGPLGLRGGDDLVVAEYGFDLSNSLVHRYSEFVENARDERPTAIAVRPNEMIVLGTHDSASTPRFGGAVLTSTGSTNAFTIRLAF